MKHCATPYYEKEVKPITGTLRGIDISNWQKGINLNIVDADFVIIKASEGVD